MSIVTIWSVFLNPVTIDVEMFIQNFTLIVTQYQVMVGGSDALLISCIGLSSNVSVNFTTANDHT